MLKLLRVDTQCNGLRSTDNSNLHLTEYILYIFTFIMGSHIISVNRGMIPAHYHTYSLLLFQLHQPRIGDSEKSSGRSTRRAYVNEINHGSIAGRGLAEGGLPSFYGSLSNCYPPFRIRAPLLSSATSMSLPTLSCACRSQREYSSQFLLSLDAWPLRYFRHFPIVPLNVSYVRKPSKILVCVLLDILRT